MLDVIIKILEYIYPKNGSRTLCCMVTYVYICAEKDLDDSLSYPVLDLK